MKKLWNTIADWAIQNSKELLVILILFAGLFVLLNIFAETLNNYIPEDTLGGYAVGLIVAAVFIVALIFYIKKVNAKVILILLLPLGSISAQDDIYHIYQFDADHTEVNAQLDTFQDNRTYLIDRSRDLHVWEHVILYRPTSQYWKYAFINDMPYVRITVLQDSTELYYKTYIIE